MEYGGLLWISSGRYSCTLPAYFYKWIFSLQWDAPHRFDSLAMGGYLLWCSSHCFSHFPLACRNLRIDIITLDFTPALSEGDHYSMANAVAEPDKVQIPRYLNAYYYYRANGEDAIPYERYTARLNRVISALLIARLQGGVRLLHH